MPRTKKQPVALHTTLLEGLTTKARKDGSVITVKDVTGKRTVAEVCIGKSKTRVNFHEAIKSALGKQTTGKSRTWAGGGVVLTDANASQVRAALLAQAKASVPATPAQRKATKPATSRTRSSRKAAVAS